MLELKATFECPACGHNEEGVNIFRCPNCQAEMEPHVGRDDLSVVLNLPKVANSAERLDDAAAADDVFAGASYSRAYGVISEALALLRAYHRKRGDVVWKGESAAVFEIGKRVGEYAKALSVLAENT